MMENFIGKKEKRTNKGTDKQYMEPDVCTKFQNPGSSSFREIFDGKKSLHTQTHSQTEKAKTIYPYILRIPGI